jgi:FkbM family methyltransferase
MDAELKQLGNYQPKERRRVTLDIGAINGVASNVLSRIFQMFYSFDPNPDLLQRWKGVATTKVFCIQLAMSESEGNATLKIPISKDW